MVFRKRKDEMVTKSSLKPRWEVKGFAPSNGEYYSFWSSDGKKFRKAEFPALREAVAFAKQKREEFDRTEAHFGGRDRIVLIDNRDGQRFWFNNAESFNKLLEQEERAVA